MSDIRAIHIDQRFPGPHVDCLRPQRVIRRIKCCQGTPPSTRLLRMDELMLVIWQSLDLSLSDQQMLWAACSLGYFGFLCTSEFTVPNLSNYSSFLYLSVQDVTVDSSLAPSPIRIWFKGSKTDPSLKGCLIHFGLGRHLSAQCMLWWHALAQGEMLLVPWFLFANG